MTGNPNGFFPNPTSHMCITCDITCYTCDAGTSSDCLSCSVSEGTQLYLSATDRVNTSSVITFTVGSTCITANLCAS